jgi:peptidoglycan hydrolase CwlO-like protein
MKTFPAILAALVVTAVIGFSMLAVGGNALLNKNSVPVQDMVQSASVSVDTVQVNQSQVQQLESLVQQYQNREKQYQQQLDEAANRLNQANQQLDEANQQLQFYQQVLAELQQAGIIRISQDGQIFLGRGFDR